MAQLRDLFANKDEITSTTAAATLFPDKELPDALDDFRKYRDRLKNAAQQAKVSVELTIQNPKAAQEEKN